MLFPILHWKFIDGNVVQLYGTVTATDDSLVFVRLGP